MNNLKEQLKQELRTEAPFTENMKQRILLKNRPVKAPAKKINWQVSVISLAFVLILGFLGMLQVTPDGVTASKMVETLPTDPKELLTLLQENETVLPIIESNGQLVVESCATYLMGKQWVLSPLPMVIEPDAEIQVGDYIAYDAGDGVTVTNVYGIAGDKVQTSHGQVTVDGDFLAIPGAVAPIEFDDAEQQELLRYYFGYQHYFDKAQKEYIDVELDPLSANEYAVYMNDKGHTAGIINDDQLIGKVVGVEKLEPSFTLTAEEQSLYDAFKEHYDLSLLVGVEPLTIMKMYLYAEMEQDYDTNYALMSNLSIEVRKVVVQNLQKNEKIKEHYVTADIQRLLSAYYYNGIEKGQFEQKDEVQGGIDYIPTNSGYVNQSLGMLKNEQGIWLPSFHRSYE